jgi:hypothetical protein
VEPLDTPCGDTGDECTNQDLCDAAGVCLDNGYQPSGTFCGNTGDGQCDLQDTCDGAGSCDDNVEPLDTPCGDTGDQCTNQDLCDASGTCLDNGYQPSGTLCGSAGDGQCDLQDTCDGAGSCDDNVEPFDTPCGDTGDQCTNQDLCDAAGVCLDNGYQPSGTLCGSAGDGQCDLQDTCDGAGTCDDIVASSGTLCGNPGDGICDLQDTCDGAGNCEDKIVLNGTGCDDGLDCTTPDECQGGVCVGTDDCPPGEVCDPSYNACLATTFASLPIDLTVCPGADFFVPITLTELGGAQALDLAFDYDPLVLAATGVWKTPLIPGSGPPDFWTMTSNISAPGHVDISLYGVTPLPPGSGAVVWVAFDAIGASGETSSLHWVEYKINGGSVLVTPVDGLVQLEAAQTSFSLPSMLGPSGQPVVIPVTATPAQGTSIDLTVEFDHTVIRVDNVRTTAISSGHTLGWSVPVDGRLDISLSGPPLSDTGDIVEIDCTVIGADGTVTPLILTHAQIDGGAITSCVDDGTLCAGIVGPVENLHFVNKTTMNWDLQNSSYYDVVSGMVDDLVPDDGVTAATCLQGNVFSNSYADSRPDPLVSEAYYYLIRAQNACWTGNYGYGNPPGGGRQPANDCD